MAGELANRDADVIVVGAAVAGSAVANAFGALGLRTLLIEKGAERDNSTRGDILHPPTLRLLEPSGVLAALHADGALPLEHIAVSHRDLGRLATYDVKLQGTGPAARTLAMPHDRIEAVMKACAERWPRVNTLHGIVLGILRDAGGRAAGVAARVDGVGREFRAPLVVGCDGGPSLVRRELGIGVERHPYNHEIMFIAAHGETDPPAAMHFNLTEQGVILVASRPRQRMRIGVEFPLGARGDLLRRPDPALYEWIVARVPWLAGRATFTRDDAYVYPLARQVADRFWAPGAALVGDAAHTTHPTGSTGMNLAISGAARLAELVGPVLAADPALSTPDQVAALGAALEAYDAERRPRAAAAVATNHQQSLKIWPDPPITDPWGYARAADPGQGWGVGGAGWGQDPAALGGAVPAS